MARPTNEQMIERLIAAIREAESISVNQLASKLPSTWKPETIESTLKRAQEAGLIIKGQGGGGGTVRLTTLASQTPDENSQTLFMNALRSCMTRDSTVYAKSSDIHKMLGWSDELFRSVRAMLQAQDRITLRRGPGARVYPQSAADPDTQAPAPSQSSRSGTRARSTSASIGTLVAKPSDERKRELRDAVERSPGRTNGSIRADLGWHEYEYWQVRTELVDEGKIAAKHGDDGIVGSFDTLGPATCPDSNVIPVLKGVMGDPEQEMVISAISNRLNITLESAVMACSRLLRFGFLQPSGDRVMLTNTFFSDDEPNADKVALLREFGDRNRAAKATLANKMAWGESRLQDVIKMCVANDPPLVEDDVDIVVRLDAATAFLQSHSDDSGMSICRSPREFAKLQSAIRTGKVTAFIGAGASVAAKLPTWARLAEQMRDRLREQNVRKEVLGMINEGDFLGAISAIERQHERDFVSDVKRELSLTRCPYPSTALIVALGCIADKFEAIVTTNLDELLEANIGYGSTPEIHPGVLSDAKSGDRKIIHAHGVLSQPEKWILTRKQYNKAFHGSGAYRDAMKSLFTGTTLMFVGYGMRDYEIDAILDQMEGSYAGGQHPTHCFFVKASDADMRPYFIHRLDALGMTPILFSDFEDLPILITRLILP